MSDDDAAVLPLRPDKPVPTIPHARLARYQERIAAMLADPECHGDLLLLGIGLLDYAVLRTETAKTFDHYAARVFNKPSSSPLAVRGILRDDIRRYDWRQDQGAQVVTRCGAPMIRRTGPCGQSASSRFMATDALTGRKQWVGACARHRDWFAQQLHIDRANRAADHDEAVSPPANAGGVLARHIPEIDWEGVWRNIDPKWTPPPEDAPAPVRVRPTLTLVVGTGADQ